MYGYIKKLLIILVTVILSGAVEAQFQEPPKPPEFISVVPEPSVINTGAVRISWTPSLSDSVSGYIIWRYISSSSQNGFQVIADDLDSLTFTFLDNTARANKQVERYIMASYRGNKNNFSSPPSPEFHTLLLNVDYDTCKSKVTLKWNGYRGIPGGAYYLVNGMFRVDDTIVTMPVVSDSEYVYSVTAVPIANEQFKTQSTKVTLQTTPQHLPDSEFFFIERVENRGSSINFVVSIDNEADLSGHSLVAGSSVSDVFSEIVFVPFDGLQKVDFSCENQSSKQYYKVRAVNTCGDTVAETDLVSPVTLKCDFDETEVHLKWNKCYINSITEQYKVYMSVDGAESVLLSEQTEQNIGFNFSEIDPENQGEVFCFYIEATDNNGNIAISDQACATREPVFNIPTGFTPNGDGLNDYYGPFINSSYPEQSYIKNAVIEEFKLQIYDRYGGVVFSTDDAGKVWGGDVNYKYVSEGGYLYYLWFKTSQGREYEKSGTINVVYP